MELARELVGKPNFEALVLSKRLMNGHLLKQMEGVMDAENVAIGTAFTSLLEQMKAKKSEGSKL